MGVDAGELRVAVVVAVVVAAADEAADEAAVEAAVEAALQPPEEVEAEGGIKAAVVRAPAGNLNQSRRNESRTERTVGR